MAMARSFCYQLSLNVPNAYYWEGPGNLGVSTRSKANQAFKWIHDSMKVNPREPVYLAGYSRGGATVIQLAKFLCETTAQQPRIIVRAMFLFDPVDRDPALSGDGIPENVRNCYVIFRDRHCEVKNVSWKPNWGYGESGDLDVYARKWMGNCVVKPDDAGKTNVETKVIEQASHGAVGGVPWTERARDEQATKDAATTMNQWLRKEGFEVKLRDMWFVHK